MKHSLLILLAAILFTGTAPAQPAPKETITIFTGGPRGTYFRFGEDIKKACPRFDVQVVSTNGSLENLSMLVSQQHLKAGSRFALVQSDVLPGVLGDQRRIDDVIAVVKSLYTETVTIAVNKNSGVKTFADLQGKKVGVGVRGSGIWFTASALKSLLGVEWVQVERSNEESVLSLLVGDIDAMVMVAGHPFGVYRDLPASVKENIEFIDLQDDRLRKFYQQQVLPANVYGWQPQKIHTVSTRSLLISARDVSEQVRKDLVDCIVSSESELRRWGHPKWNEVTFSRKKKKYG